MSVIGIDNTPSIRRLAVAPIEGFLKKPVGGQISDEGLYLYRAISEWYRVIFYTWEQQRGNKVVEWLDKEGVFRYDDILYMGELCMNTLVSEAENVIRILRMRGYTIDLFVANGPGEALAATNANVPVLLYTQPMYGLPEWLPGSQKGNKDWADLTARVERDRAARRGDKRMDEHIE